MNSRQREKLIDRRVGANMRKQRVAAKMSQETLGKAFDVTFQQVKKMEKGLNRIGSGRLTIASEMLHCTIDTFYAPVHELPGDEALGEIQVIDLVGLSKLETMDADIKASFQSLIDKVSQLRHPDEQ
ncbi:MAG: helix-turn-helix transcriptional regulator [Pseudomonadota bacterium]